MKRTIQSVIEIEGLELQLRIGWSPAERETPQAIRVDLAIDLLELPVACDTDELSQTICYDNLVGEIKKYSQSNMHCLLEHFTHGLFKCIKAHIQFPHELWLKVTKVNPPIEGVKQGVSFTLKEIDLD